MSDELAPRRSLDEERDDEEYMASLERSTPSHADLCPVCRAQKQPVPKQPVPTNKETKQ